MEKGSLLKYRHWWKRVNCYNGHLWKRFHLYNIGTGGKGLQLGLVEKGSLVQARVETGLLLQWALVEKG